MKISTQQLILSLVVVLLVFLVIVLRTPKTVEGFEDDLEDKLLNKYSDDLSGKSEKELRDLAATLRLRLDKYGLYPGGDSPDLSKYALKTEVQPGFDKCTVAIAEDRDKYMHKSDIANLEATNKVDLSKYVLKSSIPPEKVCPPQKEIDYSKYVLKSTLPPNRKCPPCICPKVKVSAGLCKKCPPPPKCPPPEPCKTMQCPEPKPCPEQGNCPSPQPCPTQKQKIRYDVKYIKVPTIITKTVTKDESGNVLTTSYQAESDKDNTNRLQGSSFVNNAPSPNPTKNLSSTTVNSTAEQESDNAINAEIIEEEFTPKPSFAVSSNAKNCASPQLNNAFKKSGVYGYPY